MLALLFSIGEVPYAVACDRVREIVPVPELKPIPRAPAPFVGVFNYRGRIVPVVDLCRLIRGDSCRLRLSTRIILAEAPAVGFRGGDAPRIYGLLAERVTETVRAPDRESLEPAVRLRKAPYLGAIMMKDGEMIQWIDLDRLPDALDFLSGSDPGERNDKGECDSPMGNDFPPRARSGDTP